MTGPSDRLLLSFYGDDFTGSSAVLEILASAGLRTVLFLRPPTREQLGRYPGLRAVGVAGMSRTMSPDEMDRELPSAFGQLRELGAEVFHYKTCSTFDSSPVVGSIGRAIDLGQRLFASPWVPLVVAAPVIRRYCLFGNLFATVAGRAYRLDRHPVMSVHPVTPMDEADLRVHLSRQTRKPCGLMDVVALTGTPGEVNGRLQALLGQTPRPEIVLFDAVDDRQIVETGRLLWEQRAQVAGGHFTVGSQGVEYALVEHWREAGLVPREPAAPRVSGVDQLLVMSGSCSTVTAGQISRALEHGFASVDVDAAALVDPATRPRTREAIVGRTVALLREGRDVVVHSACGPNDPRVGSARQVAVRTGVADLGRHLGEEMGQALRAICGQHRLARVLLSGGDTSGHGTRALDVEALELAAPGGAGAPLCRAHAPGQPTDGLELALKGGQMGNDDLFLDMKHGFER
jgi:uncharacterized protein YgbK (DUF1537 family)